MTFIVLAFNWCPDLGLASNSVLPFWVLAEENMKVQWSLMWGFQSELEEGFAFGYCLSMLVIMA